MVREKYVKRAIPSVTPCSFLRGYLWQLTALPDRVCRFIPIRWHTK